MFDIIFLYLSSGCEKFEAFKILDTWIRNQRPTIIIGDVNVDFVNDCKFSKFLENKGFKQLVKKATCDTGSLIDHVYVNELLITSHMEIEQSGVYYSDHDIITIYIKK